MMTATAMRAMMTITTMNDGAGDSDVFFGLIWWMPSFPQPAALTRREAKCLCAKRNAHRQSPKESSSQASAHPLPDDAQRARGSARSQIRIARSRSTLSTPGLCKHPPARKFAPRAYT